jgi:tetratricopeptide (TPR) repeat protein
MRTRLAEANEHRQHKRYEQARHILDELYRAHPDDAEVNYHYAWLLDNMGKERAAIPFYERAIASGLSGGDLQNALLGLGSSYRCVGHYAKSVDLLRRAIDEYPDAREFPVFLAMALYNTGDHRGAMELLMRELAETTADDGIKRYAQAILFYADKLDQVWT